MNNHVYEERPVTVLDMLEARDRRAFRQRELAVSHNAPLISFTMNIAGPVKNSPLIRRGFDEGLRILKNQLRAAGISLLYMEEIHEFTGNEALLAPSSSPEILKKVTSEIEDFDRLGRLFDMDVIREDGSKVDREELGFPTRTCLICGKPAKDCARSRTHTAAELQAKTKEILTAAVREADSETAADLAVRSLLFEAAATPKPGLVDRANAGSHSDMDIFTFLSSAGALRPYFKACTLAGMDTRDLPAPETFKKLQVLGRRAEGAMYEATDGVNTHKGAVFSLGILCGALGRLPRAAWSEPETVLAECGKETEGLTETYFPNLTKENARTAGEILYVRHGIRGVRGQAEDGFPAVLRYGLPVLEEGLAGGLSLNDVGCAALLHMMVHETDTNMIKRSDLATYDRVINEVRGLLKKNRFPGSEMLAALDERFIAMNLSPGGTADLLAMTYFLHFLKNA